MDKVSVLMIDLSVISYRHVGLAVCCWEEHVWATTV